MSRVTTEGLKKQGHLHAKAWEAKCPKCGGTCRQHSTTGVLEFNEHGYGFWTDCRCSPPGPEMVWRQV
jgi:hypothetical protein